MQNPETDTGTRAPSMGFFETQEAVGGRPHEMVTFFQDPATGLQAIIAIHSTSLGPALGGTRLYPYQNEQAALTDALRLSQGMTYKYAAAGLDAGGAKGIIIGDPVTFKTESLLKAYGRSVQKLSGRFVTAGDAGIASADLNVMGTTSDYILGRDPSKGGYGDSSAMTALGVLESMRAAVEARLGSPNLDGLRVGVEGVGKVGYELVRMLIEHGARVCATDVSRSTLERAATDFPSVAIMDDVIDADIDVYAPCAVGPALTTRSAANMQAQVICGSSNNQLADPYVEYDLAERNILWVPDYVASAGGIILGFSEYQQWPLADVEDKVKNLFHTTETLLQTAKRDGILPGTAADRLAEERIYSIST